MAVSNRLKTVTIADPIEGFDPEAETTYFLLSELSLRNHECWITTPRDLILRQDEVLARARRLRVEADKKKFRHEILGEKLVALSECDCILLRKDPPVDEAFHDHLILLSLLENRELRGKTSPLMINYPSGIQAANEKIYPLRFEGLSPPAIVTAVQEEMERFLKEHPKSVLKPLNESGGKGVFILRKDDPNRHSIMETATRRFTRQVMVQSFVPQASEGDKRILLLDGKPLGSFLRVPPEDDFRCNMHSGAHWVKAGINAHEERMIRVLAPQLRSQGLYFVGLDLIGPFITEVNTTSPMGIREINHFDNSHVEKTVIDWVETSCLSRRMGRGG